MAKKTKTAPDATPSRAKTAAPKKTAATRSSKAATAATQAPVPAEQEAVPTFTITRDDIATLAFSYWESRGCQGGSPEEDWRRAEQELVSLLG